jgi:ubiquinone/menaquinone biosynthesis C-methylase UbiE
MTMEASTPAQSSQLHEGSAAIARFNAVFFDMMDWYMHRKYRSLKSRLFAALPAEVLEIGAGTGANLRYLARGTRVLACEPNACMHAALRSRAQRHGVDLEVHAGGAERLPVPTGSVDAVIASLVLCTVEDPRAVLDEIVRVLKPGGRFICIEHVAACPGTLTARLQRWLHRPWSWLFEGCHTHRDTGRMLQEAGFASVAVEKFTWRSMFVPVRPQIAAVCTR